jgi:7,8-dihydropterin-6-yl-methyl-4-(beta-D-ribofuranosyl)aminobenzene 5'-phosphate synthase
VKVYCQKKGVLLMKDELNRREFLKTTVGAGAVLMAGGVMTGTNKAYGAVTIEEVDRVVITIVTDNYYDALRPDAAAAKRFRAQPGKWMHAEHGLSCFIETISNGKAGGFMFDYGLDAQGVKRNMDVLGIDVGKADGFGLSHGHFDHWGAFTEMLAMNRTRIKKGTPLYLGEGAFARRYALMPGTTDRLDIGQFNRADVEASGLVRIVEVRQPTEVMPGGYFSGPVEQVTEYEKVPPALLVKQGDAVVVDSFPGEQAMAFNLRGKGLVVLSGCAHRGIVNTVKHVQKLAGIEKVYAVVGGFHLVNAKPEVIDRTVADIKSINPAHVVPAHCTGFEATIAFSKAMPEQFILNTAGTRYTFPA